MLAIGFLLVGIGFALTGSATTMPALLGTWPIWSLGEMIGAPVSYAYVADLAPPDLRGRYQGIFGLAWGSGAVTGPAIAGALLPEAAAVFWPLLGVLGLASAGWSWAPGRRSIRLPPRLVSSRRLRTCLQRKVFRASRTPRETSGAPRVVDARRSGIYRLDIFG